MLFDHPGDLFDRFQTASNRPRIPILEDIFREGRVTTCPVFIEGLLDRPRPGSLEILSAEGFEDRTLCVGEILVGLQPAVFAAREIIAALGQKRLVL